MAFPGSEHALTHSDVWKMKGLTSSVAVVGAAAPGCLRASVFAAFGSRVRLLDVAPRILGGEDAAVSRGLGAHIVGEQAVEVVQLAAAAMRAGMPPVEQLAGLELAYPTFTSVVGLAACQVIRNLDPASPRRRRASGRPGAAEWKHGERE